MHYSINPCVVSRFERCQRCGGNKTCMYRKSLFLFGVLLKKTYLCNRIKTKPINMEKVVRIVKLGNEDNELNYWLSTSYEDRIRELERIRAEVNHRIYGTQSRLQRVYTIVKRT